MGLKIRSLEPEGVKNVQGTLTSLQGQAGLEISEKKWNPRERNYHSS